MTAPVTLDQIEALFARELSPLREAVEANTAKLISMESKLGDHDALFETVTRRLEALESAPVNEKVESAISIVENKMTLKYEANLAKENEAFEAKMDKVNVNNEANSKHLIEQLFAAGIEHAKNVHKGGSNYENKTFIDIPMNGEQLPFFADKCFRGPHMIYPSSQLVIYMRIPSTLLVTPALRLKIYISSLSSRISLFTKGATLTWNIDLVKIFIKAV